MSDREIEIYLSPVMRRARAIAAAKLGMVLEKYEELRRARVKWCYQCRRWRKVDEFGICQSKGDGLQSACIDCTRIRARQNRQKVRTHVG